MFQSRTALALATIALALFSGRCRTAEAAAGITVEVAAGVHPRQNVRVSLDLPPELAGCEPLSLVEVDSGKPVPMQVDRAVSPPRAVWIVRQKLAAGQTRLYRLAPGVHTPAPTDAVSVTDDGQRLVVKIGAKHVLSYNHAVVPSPDPNEPYYARSGYIHPVFSPSGRLVSDDFNPNHAHQHGIMFAWRKLTCEGRTSNGWDQKASLGKVEHVKIDAFGGGPVFGHFTVRLRQVDLTAPGGPVPVLDETWRVRVDNLTDRYLFDLEAAQTCAGKSPVTIDEIHYGGLMVRGAAGWNKPPCYDFLTSDGKNKTDGNHTRPRWVDLFGPIDGQTTGIVSLDHPGNFRFPQPVRLHPTMPYFCFTPAVLGSFTIEPEKVYKSRYRFVVHDGALTAAAIESLWTDYADPPCVRVVR